MRISYVAFELLVRFGLKQNKKRREEERRGKERKKNKGGKDEFFIQLNNENKIDIFFLLIFSLFSFPFFSL